MHEGESYISKPVKNTEEVEKDALKGGESGAERKLSSKVFLKKGSSFGV